MRTLFIHLCVGAALALPLAAAAAAPAGDDPSATTPEQTSFFVGGTWSTPFISPVKAGL